MVIFSLVQSSKHTVSRGIWATPKKAASRVYEKVLAENLYVTTNFEARRAANFWCFGPVYWKGFMEPIQRTREFFEFVYPIHMSVYTSREKEYTYRAILPNSQYSRAEKARAQL